MFNKSLDGILNSFHKTLQKLDAYVVKTEATIARKISLADAHQNEVDRLSNEAANHHDDIGKAQATRSKIAELIGA